jgi:hypothetical protein
VRFVKFNVNDPLDIQRAVHDMEAAVDARVAPYSQNELVANLAAKMKERLRQHIQERAVRDRVGIAPGPQSKADSDVAMDGKVEVKRKRRYDFMKALYDATDGRERSYQDSSRVSS